jgi:hypothetical protein
MCLRTLMLSSLSVLVLALALSEGRSQDGKKDEARSPEKKAEPPAKKTESAALPRDIETEIDKADTKKLIEDLKQAPRIDRRGQQLLKLRAALQTTLAAATREQTRLSADRATVRALEVLQEPRARARIKEIRAMPLGKERQAAYDAFLKELDISARAVISAAELQHATLKVTECQADLKRVESWIEKNIQQKGDVVVAVRPVGDQSLDRIRRMMSLLDPETKDPQKADMPAGRPSDNLDFLKVFEEGPAPK